MITQVSAAVGPRNPSAAASLCALLFDLRVLVVAIETFLKPPHRLVVAGPQVALRLRHQALVKRLRQAEAGIYSVIEGSHGAMFPIRERITTTMHVSCGNTICSVSPSAYPENLPTNSTHCNHG